MAELRSSLAASGLYLAGCVGRGKGRLDQRACRGPTIVWRCTMASRRSANVGSVALALVLVAMAASAEPEKTPPAVASEADGKIATEIEHRLSRDPEVNATAVELDVRGGVV